MNNTLTLLTKTRDLLSDPRRWTQNVLARDSQGRYVRLRDESAVSFCAFGAIYRTAFDLDMEEGYILKSVRQEIYTTLNQEPFSEFHVPEEDTELYNIKNEQKLAAFNDTKTHKDVLFLFDTVIARLKEQAKAEGTGQ